MIATRWFVVSALALNLLFVPAATAQSPSIPADIQKIFEKIRSQQELTDTERNRMREWSKTVRPGYGGSEAGAKPGASKGSSGNGSAPEIKTTGTGQKGLPCPPATAVAVPIIAPTIPEYAALVKSLIATYGAKLGADRAAVDVALGQASLKSDSSGIAAMLLVTGSANASVYVSAVAAQQPGNLQAANNLAVALDAIPDSKNATTVFLHIRKMQPNVALGALNLGWSYYNSGNVALAQKQFEQASQLDSHLAGPDAGLGMLAACRGDQNAAFIELRKSLGKGFSGVAAMGYRNAKAAQKPPETYDAPTPDPNAGPVPELPASSNSSDTASSADAFRHAQQFADGRVPAVFREAQEATKRVLALARRHRQNPDGTVDLPRVFDKQLFEFSEMLELTLAPVIRQNAQAQEPVINAIGHDAEQLVKQFNVQIDQIQRLNEQGERVLEKEDACKKSCLGDQRCENGCEVKFHQEYDPIQFNIQQIEYQMCKEDLDNSRTTYSREFKLWKPFSDSVRASSRDLYAFSDPVIAEIWAPALHDLVQARREFAVLSVYKQVAEGAGVMADLGKHIDGLKCVPPPPPQPPKAAIDPDLKKKKSDCPLESPVEISLGGLKLEVGCDKIKIEGGQGIKFKFERNSKKGETAVWIGAGVDIASVNIDLAKGVPNGSAKAGISGSAGMGIRFNDQGAILDVNETFSVKGSVSAGGFSASAGVSSGVSLENGVNFDTSASASGPGTGFSDMMDWLPPGVGK